MSRRLRSGRLRTLFITSDLNGRGGIQRYSRWLANALRDNAELIVVDLRLDGTRRRRLIGFGGALVALVRHRPDLVVLGHVGFGPVGWVAQLLRRPYVVVVYGIEVWGPVSHRSGVTLRRARRVWPISSFTSAEVRRLYSGVPTAPALGGSLDDKWFEIEHQPGFPVRILTVTRIDDLPYKGIDISLRAIERLIERHPLEFRVVGAGPDEDELRRLAAGPLLRGSVKLIGAVEEAELMEEYRRATAVVLVSRYRSGNHPMGEGLGLALLEAAAAGVPAIGSSIGGSTDVILDRVTGFLIAPGDEAELYERLDSLLSDRLLAEEMGHRARQWARAVHSHEAFSRRVRERLEELVVSPSSSSRGSGQAPCPQGSQ